MNHWSSVFFMTRMNSILNKFKTLEWMSKIPSDSDLCHNFDEFKCRDNYDKFILFFYNSHHARNIQKTRSMINVFRMLLPKKKRKPCFIIFMSESIDLTIKTWKILEFLQSIQTERKRLVQEWTTAFESNFDNNAKSKIRPIEYHVYLSIFFRILENRILNRLNLNIAYRDYLLLTLKIEHRMN